MCNKFRNLVSAKVTAYLLVHFIVLAPVVQKVDNAIHWINHYPLESAIGFPNTYPWDSDLSVG